MEKQIFDMLVKMQSSMEKMQSRMDELQFSIKELQSSTGEIHDRLIRVENIVNKIEASQTEDVIGMLKVTKKKTDFELEYLNYRVTEIDKRIFKLEKHIQN